MIKKAINFFKYPLVLKIIVLKTFLYSFWFEACLKFKWYSFTKALQNNQNPIVQNKDDDQLILAQVRKGIRVIKKYAPWKPKCHNLAITAKQILKESKIGTTIHVGFKKESNKEIKGHAWLTHYNKVIIGKIKDLDMYKKLS